MKIIRLQNLSNKEPGEEGFLNNYRSPKELEPINTIAIGNKSLEFVKVLEEEDFAVLFNYRDKSESPPLE